MDIKEGLIPGVVDKLADKIYQGLQIVVESKVTEVADILPELAGLALIICGGVMMFGDLQKWLGRTGIVAVVGTVLVVLF